MNYKITKASRLGGTPYAGPTYEAAGTPPAHIYTNKEEAERDAKKMAKHNPVGFTVQEADQADLTFSQTYKKALSQGQRI